MHATYDPAVDAAYIAFAPRLWLSGAGGRMVTTSVPGPGDSIDVIALDWLDGKLAGMEVLDASTLLPEALLAEAERILGAGRVRGVRGHAC